MSSSDEYDEHRALLVASPRGVHHFAGVAEALAERGVACEVECLQERTPSRLCARMARRVRAIVHADGVSSHAEPLMRTARQVGWPVALLMDGVLEYANTFLNDRAGQGFLRPAPANIVLAAGTHDRAILRALGNRSVATGLPRIEAFARDSAHLHATPGSALLIATANQPAFTLGARRRIVESLAMLRDEASRRGIETRWRIAADIAQLLGVEPDQSTLIESLGRARAVISTASTLVLEAMIAGRPTAVLHPHPWPLWLPSAWVWRGESRSGWDTDVAAVADLRGEDERANSAARRSAQSALGDGETLDESDVARLLESLLTPCQGLMATQRNVLAHCCSNGSSRRVARIVEHLTRASSSPAPERLPSRTITAMPPSSGVLRVVSIIESHGSSIGGVSSWSQRLEARFASMPDLGVEWHTLYLAPYGRPPTGLSTTRQHAHTCETDPTAPLSEQVEAVAAAIRGLDARVVLPNYGELAHASAMHWRAGDASRRVVAVAHTNDEVYRGFLSAYHAWDAAVAVSPACEAWVRDIAGGRAVEHIPYGVALHERRDLSSRRAPLRIGYIGRVVERQKRVSLLLDVLRGLTDLGLDYEFHLVGDGDALQAWQRDAAHAGLDRRVTIHGSRPLDWVERFLRTLDVSVITSDAEGLSIAMLEAMAAGVVPCVTRVDRTIDQLLIDGENAVVTAVDGVDQMAPRLAELARDRSLLSRTGEAARRTITQHGLTLEACAHHYAELLRRVTAEPQSRPRATDLGLRAPNVIAAVGAAEYAPELERCLRAAGYERIVHDSVVDPPPASPTAVVIRATDEHPGEAAIQALRASGVGVAVEPTLCDAAHTHITHSFERLVDGGCRRIAVFWDEGATLAALDWIATKRADHLECVIHLDRPAGATLLGVPALSVAQAKHRGIDGVVLSSAFGGLIARAATRPLRLAGVRLLVESADARQRAHIDTIMDDAEKLIRLGGAVSSTAGVLVEGVTRHGPRSTRPDLLILRGDEADFSIFHALRPWRDQGTTIRSLRWPDTELSAPERFQTVVRGLGPHARYGLFGGGLHTRRLLSIASDVPRPSHILDDAATPGAMLAGVPIISPDDPAAEGLDAVILSSTLHERAMWIRSARLREAGVTVIPLYGQTDGTTRSNRGAVFAT